MLPLLLGIAIAQDAPPPDDSTEPTRADVTLEGDARQMVIAIPDVHPAATRWRIEALIQAGGDRFRWTETAAPVDGEATTLTTSLPRQVEQYLDSTGHDYLIDLSVNLKAENDEGHLLRERSVSDHVLAGRPGAVEILPTSVAMTRYPWGMTVAPSEEIIARLVPLVGEGGVRILAPNVAPRRYVDDPMLGDRPGRTAEEQPTLPETDEEVAP